MPRKTPMQGTGPDGTFTVEDVAKPKKSNIGQRRRKGQDVHLPPELLALALTPAKLASGTYQKKILAFFGPLLAPALMNSLLRSLDNNSPQAQKLVAEMFEFVKKSGINIALNQNNDNRSAHLQSNVSESGPVMRFEDIIRMQDAGRQRALAAPHAVFVATPED